MTTQECDAVLHSIRNALEHVQEARQKARESDVQSCRSIVGLRLTEGGKKLLEAEREMFSIREGMEKLARGETLGPEDGIEAVLRGGA